MKAPRQYATPERGCTPRSYAFKADRWFGLGLNRTAENAGNERDAPKPPPTRAKARGGDGSALTLLIPKHFYTGE